VEDKPLINRLLSGIVIYKLKDKTINIKPAKVEDKAFAEFYSLEIYEDALLEGILKKEDLHELLIEKGWWTKEQDEKIETISKNLEQMKLDYYNNFFRDETKKYIKQNIDKQTKNVTELHEKKHLFYDKSCEYLKKFSYDVFLVEKNAFVGDHSALNYFKIHSIVYAYYSNTLNDKHIRKIAKSLEWKSLWNASKNDLFHTKGCELTQEQISLVTWAKFYDGVSESMEKPSDEVIADDLALDGWCISESRKRKEEEKKRKGEEMTSDQLNDAGEIFVPVKNKREQDQVLALNDPYGKSVIRSKAKQFKETGGAREEDLKHVKKEIQMEGLRQAKESRR